MGQKKMGRPTDNPKNATIKIRMDEDSMAMLKVCSERLGITRSEVVRSAIRKTFEALPKE